MNPIEVVTKKVYKCLCCKHLFVAEGIILSKWAFKGIVTFWCPRCGLQLQFDADEELEVKALLKEKVAQVTFVD